jgi:DNA-binding FadR family transcriptional regulator
MNTATEIRPKGLHAHVVDELGARIVRGDYPPERLLPIEDALVVELGVSRTVVREAVKVLAQKNLIRVRTRIGTTVCAPSEWNHLDPDILRWRFAGEFDPQLVRDVIDLRRIIEPAAAEIAAQRASAQSINAITAAFREMTETSDLQTHINADLRFHLAILDASGNELLRGLRHSIEGALRFAIQFTTHSKDQGRTSQDWHTKVFESIVAREPFAARAAMSLIVESWAAESLQIVEAKSKRDVRARASKKLKTENL